MRFRPFLRKSRFVQKAERKTVKNIKNDNFSEKSKKFSFFVSFLFPNELLFIKRGKMTLLPEKDGKDKIRRLTMKKIIIFFLRLSWRL